MGMRVCREGKAATGAAAAILRVDDHQREVSVARCRSSSAASGCWNLRPVPSRRAIVLITYRKRRNDSVVG
eukprot:scaffold122930_cov21-Phaeocystis_antarctica.AAC.1